MKNGSSRICDKRHVDGNQTILVWATLASKRRHIRDTGPELEALVTFATPRKSAMDLKCIAARHKKTHDRLLRI